MEVDDVAKLSFREFAQVVGICDAIFSCLGFIGNFMLVLNREYLGIPTWKTVMEFKGPAFVVDCLITTVQLYWAIMLINAASTGRTAKNAATRVIPYVVCNGIVLVAYFIWRIVDKNWKAIAIFGMMRLAALIVVVMYLFQLIQIQISIEN